jgi:uncharacterized membrane protein YfcA
MPISAHVVALLLITFGASIVNGALGYGFSSITVPLALLFLTNRVLNPALILIELVLNAWVLWVNRDAVPAVWRRMLPTLVGLVPGVALGTLIVSQVSPAWLKLATYTVLLPLILVQASGYRRPIRSERTAWLGLGGAIGLLYSVTTISGPPLAVMLNNQGFAKREFRAALGVVRLTESTLTAAAYLSAGLFTRESVHLLPQILPGVALGVPLGALLIRRLDPETFRRICMSFDAWTVAFGIVTLLHQLDLVQGSPAYSVMVVVGAVDAWLLCRFFRIPRRWHAAYD